jgi:hypothetical protein
VARQEHGEHPRPSRPLGQDPGRVPGAGGAQRSDQLGDSLRPGEAGLPGGISVQQGPGRVVVPGGAQPGQQRGGAAGVGQADMRGIRGGPGGQRAGRADVAGGAQRRGPEDRPELN